MPDAFIVRSISLEIASVSNQITGDESYFGAWVASALDPELFQASWKRFQANHSKPVPIGNVSKLISGDEG